MFSRLKTFFIEAQQEFRHVQWPTRDQAIRLTLFVIVLSLSLALFLGFFDYFFSYLLKTFVVR